MNNRCYSELIKIPTFEERFNYLKVPGSIGENTFGQLRYLCQKLYTSPQYRSFRDTIVVRDFGCEMALEDYPIYGRIIIHHINPLTPEDIIYMRPCITDPENVISVSEKIHNFIHFGSLPECYIKPIIERYPNDMAPWLNNRG